MSTSYARARQPRSEAALRVEHLLGRYPDLAEQELTELIQRFPHLDMISRAMMAADDRLGRNLQDFYRAHVGKLDLVVPPRTSFFALAVLCVILVFWLVLG